ncbi:MAG: class I SAM-dependent methyltransferase, partial [Thermodesulfobacteriota bacterium]|nr:class I SAM-dependent methyltransferase [Thermodesulfobacteriota bacterium]
LHYFRRFRFLQAGALDFSPIAGLLVMVVVLNILNMASLTKGKITAVDNHAPFVGLLAEAVRDKGLESRIRPLVGDMTALDFPDRNFDLIWCEGAIYNIGFDKGISSWRRLLRPGGCMAVSEAVWLRPDVPEECQRFWDECYPAIRGVRANLDAIGAHGFDVLGHFTQGQECWTQEFNAPLKERMRLMEEKYPNDEAAGAVLKRLRHEIDMYDRYKDYYGYEFFVMRRAD